MKNLTDFKKRLQVGKKLHAIHHLSFNGRDEKGTQLYTDKDLGTREISIVQTNSFALKTTKQDGSIVDSWCQYPKAKECIFKDQNTITILKEQRDGKLIPMLTYTFID
jgi:hypothetical protein